MRKVLIGAFACAALAAGLVSGCWTDGGGTRSGSGAEIAPAAPVRAAGGAAEASQVQVDAAVAKVFPALIRIYVVGKYYDGGREQKSQSSGSGAIITPDGYAVTNHHVVGKARNIRVTLANRDEAEATLVGSDPLADIAVIKLKPETMRTPVKQFPCAQFGDSARLKVGDVVLAMGSPGALSQSVTQGIVSNTELILPWGGANLDGEPVGSLVRWIAHDAAIIGGNSGGPLVDLSGRIVGINEIGVASLGGAIPANLAKRVADELIRTGDVRRSSIGAEVRPLLRGSKLDRGVLVNAVAEGSPAAKAGLKSGDVITAFDGKPVQVRWAEELPEFNRLVLETPVGKEVAVEYLRAGKAGNLKLTTAARGKARGEDEEVRSWGATFRDLTEIAARELKRPATDGVMVTSVRPGGPSGQAKPQLVPGDLIVRVGERDVKDLEELKKASAQLTAGKTEPVLTVVAFERGTERLLTAIRIGPAEDDSRSPEVRKAWFPAAVQVFTRNLAEAMNLKGTRGVLVTQMFPGSAAEKAGFQLGDVITHVDGSPVEASQPEDDGIFPAMIRRYKIGAEAEMTVVRAGKPVKLKIELPAAPVPVAEMKRYRDEVFEFTGRDVAFNDRARNKWEESQAGVFVEAVEQAGWGALAGMRVGDLLLEIDGQPVADVAALEKIMKALRATKPASVTFFVKRGVHGMYLELEPDWAGATN
ncbi:MAG TPA: PDZ domain-containing protein [Planctomycetota bacterium]|nr:PDZ domain-containing protein [Planctomycetota bacterium]